MEMCYAGEIAMPSSYVVMNEEEMTYTEGGIDASVRWYGVCIHYTPRDLAGIVAVLGVGSGGVGYLRN